MKSTDSSSAEARARVVPPRRVWIAIAATLLSMACDSLPDHVKENARRRRVRELGIEFDTAGNAPKAGISVLREITVEPLDPRPLGADTASPAYHVLVHRCGGCHPEPDPGQLQANQWEAVVTRMESLIEDAGILPLVPRDRETILSFLLRHAKEGSRGPHSAVP